MAPGRTRLRRRYVENFRSRFFYSKAGDRHPGGHREASLLLGYLLAPKNTIDVTEFSFCVKKEKPA